MNTGIEFVHEVGQTIKGDFLFVTFSDDSVAMYEIRDMIRDRETMGKETFFRVYGFDVDVGWLREASGVK